MYGRDATRAVLGRRRALAPTPLLGSPPPARAVSRLELLEAGDAVHDWRERMLDLHGEYARKAKGYPVWA